MEWFLTRLVQSWDVINGVTMWAQDHVLAAIFFGAMFMKILDYIVKKTPTKYDDMTLEIIEDAIKGAWDKVQSTKKGR